MARASEVAMDALKSEVKILQNGTVHGGETGRGGIRCGAAVACAAAANWVAIDASDVEM